MILDNKCKALKKNIPDPYVNQDENKKKLDEENKNQNSVEFNNDVSMKGTQIITEDNINNSKMEKNNLSEQNSINMNQQNIQSTSSKTSNIRENKSNKNEKPKNPKKDVFHKQRKSVDYMNTFHFKRKSLIINTNENPTKAEVLSKLRFICFNNFSCLNLFIYIRNEEKFQDLDEIWKIVEKIYYVFLNI